jgi:RNA polymerase sigma-70 factor (ECF subfamily)
VRELERRFVDVYEATYVDLVRFAARRGHLDQAEDVVAETFTVAWRRVSDLPEDLDEARAWLFGIARNVLMASHRKETRSLPVRIGGPEDWDSADLGHEETVVAALDIAAAWNRLTSVHQEALSLTVWEGLTSAQAATVLGISPVAYRIRLSRARRALAHLMEAVPPASRALTLVQKGTRP